MSLSLPRETHAASGAIKPAIAKILEICRFSTSVNLKIFLPKLGGTARGVMQRTHGTIGKLKLDREVLDRVTSSTRGTNLSKYELRVTGQKRHQIDEVTSFTN